jgi:hypothetical protein
MMTMVNGAEAEQTMPEVQDSTDGACGSVAFEIVNEVTYEPYFTLD